MVMVRILVEHMPQGAFAQQNHSGQRFVSDRPYPALRIGVQVRRPRRQRDPLDPGGVNDLLKGRAIFPIPIVDQLLPWGQEAPCFHGHVARHLHHPPFVRM